MLIQNNISCNDAEIFKQFGIRRREIQDFRSKLLYQTLSFFNGNGYMLIDPPILHEHISKRKKGVSAFIGSKEYDLNMSNALYISVYATIYGDVFALSPTFREEKKSDNHLIEFRMLECESANSDFQQCIELIQNYLKFILNTMIKQCTGSIFKDRLILLNDRLSFETMTYKELISELRKNGVSIEYGDDLSDCDLEVSKLLRSPTFVVDYPHPPATWTALPKDDTTYTFNLLLPDGFGELAEGGQRNNDYRIFQEKFEEAGLYSLSWYVAAIKQNPCTRSGFGLGIERLTSWLIGNHSIHETVLFYREGN